MEGFNYYRIKTSFVGEQSDGKLAKKKAEELVYAVSYADAEATAYRLVEAYNRTQFSSDISVEIIKTKIDTLLYNDILQKSPSLVNNLVETYFEDSEDTGVGLYGVKVLSISVDERTGKEKRATAIIHTPARTNAEATAIVNKYLTSSANADYVIRDAKFDPAASILWPVSEYDYKVKSMGEA